ncbi:Cytochrome b-c1 complex subunit 7 [Capsicum annuum]|uniref:Cytochrome b-c1 complex subunit 7 n=1 Tax=Capsicum annuum TaxID=4072 RepID=A0A2G2Z874_CAPAN|nr:Cytochrome b-c1 complex subunit 7 [Capsicum annuum]
MYDLDVKEALNRLPREIVDAKNQYLLCAMDLFMKHPYLPEDLQIEILRRLCDDVIEAESIQSTLNKRIMAAENTDFYQNLKSCSFKYRRVSMNVVAGSRKGGFVFLFNWKVLRYFRKDGHNWRRKDGKTVKEAQEKLEIGKRSSEFVMCLHVVAALNSRIRKYNEAIPHLERSIEIPDLDMGQNLSLAKFSWFMHLCDTYQCSGS